MQPKVYISYSPGKAGSVFALFYFESGKDIYGWHVETRNLYFSAAFFMLENFYADRPPRLYRSIEDDVYCAWTIDYPPTRDDIRCPVPDSVGHELERLQSMFVDEWLFFANDVGVEAELSAYRDHDLPVHGANIRWRRLQRLRKQGACWVHASPGADVNVVQMLHKYWRLNEKVPVA